MQTIFATARVVFAVFLSVLTIGGCSNTQINTELPLSHPTNPTAEESAFVPPPNPFATDASFTEPGRQKSDARKPEEQPADAMHHQEMQTMQPENDIPASRPEKNTEHQH